MKGIISVAGVLPRMGTTTLSLQLVKFLQSTGYTAAYVECNRQQYIWAVASTYGGQDQRVQHKEFEYAGIPMFSHDSLSRLTSGSGQYEYLICDYGCIQLRAFTEKNKNGGTMKDEYMNAEASILTVGSAPNELGHSMRFMRSAEFSSNIYAFYETPAPDEEEILARMDDYRDRTVFIPHMPDPFGDYTLLYQDQNGFFFNLMNMVVATTEEKKTPAPTQAGPRIVK